MADHRKSRNHHWLYAKVCAALILLIVFYHTGLQNNSLNSIVKRDLLISTVIPVEYIDPTSIDLTPLVNTLIDSTHSGSHQLFSLLSVTSHSSLSLHKFTLLVYNISNFQNFETKVFPMRFCYCVSNQTNDLTDFTAILLDVIGNSSSYLQEIFKSSSILSVDQSNSSECIYICVMAGKSEEDLSKLWEMESIKPLFNQTVTADFHKGNASMPESPIGIFSSTEISRIQASTLPAQAKTTATLGTTTRMVTWPLHREWSGCPRKGAERIHVGGGAAEAASVSSTSSTAVSAQKLQPCLLELCKFFSQCLCHTYTRARRRRQAEHRHNFTIIIPHSSAQTMCLT
ncbi:hypothetical protein GJAV_G00095150 [Gymnothorax javanicus]|nr:hypothetical protein GJAV_G00095150 [Gymnothorax javanicus]